MAIVVPAAETVYADAVWIIHQTRKKPAFFSQAQSINKLSSLSPKGREDVLFF